MKSRTFVYFVCSPVGRVGKTTTARLLADYFLLGGRTFVGCDTDPREPVFASWFVDRVAVVDLNTVRGNMALFDPLLVNDGVPKIVDLWHRSWDKFFTVLRDTEFVAESRRVSVEPVWLFLVDGSSYSVEVAEELVQAYPDVTMVAVHNEGAAPLGAASFSELARYPASRTFKIAALDPVLQQTIESANFSLSRFIPAPPTGMSIVVRSGLRSWLGRIFAQFHSFELSTALEEAEHLG
jgi:hypothetical protein